MTKTTNSVIYPIYQKEEYINAIQEYYTLKVQKIYQNKNIKTSKIELSVLNILETETFKKHVAQLTDVRYGRYGLEVFAWVYDMPEAKMELFLRYIIPRIKDDLVSAYTPAANMDQEYLIKSVTQAITIYYRHYYQMYFLSLIQKINPRMTVHYLKMYVKLRKLNLELSMDDDTIISLAAEGGLNLAPRSLENLRNVVENKDKPILGRAKSHTKKYFYNGEAFPSLRDLVEKCGNGLTYGMVCSRINTMGMSLAEALSAPRMRKSGGGRKRSVVLA